MWCLRSEILRHPGGVLGADEEIQLTTQQEQLRSRGAPSPRTPKKFAVGQPEPTASALSQCWAGSTWLRHVSRPSPLCTLHHLSPLTLHMLPVTPVQHDMFFLRHRWQYHHRASAETSAASKTTSGRRSVCQGGVDRHWQGKSDEFALLAR